MAMVKDVYYGKTLRKSYQKHDEILKMPNMLRIQKDSYDNFLKTGLQEVFGMWARLRIIPIIWS